MGRLFEDIADSFAYFRSLRKDGSLRGRRIREAIESGNYAVINVDNSKEGDKK